MTFIGSQWWYIYNKHTCMQAPMEWSHMTMTPCCPVWIISTLLKAGILQNQLCGWQIWHTFPVDSSVCLQLPEELELRNFPAHPRLEALSEWVCGQSYLSSVVYWSPVRVVWQAILCQFSVRTADRIMEWKSFSKLRISACFRVCDEFKEREQLTTESRCWAWRMFTKREQLRKRPHGT